MTIYTWVDTYFILTENRKKNSLIILPFLKKSEVGAKLR